MDLKLNWQNAAWIHALQSSHFTQRITVAEQTQNTKKEDGIAIITGKPCLVWMVPSKCMVRLFTPLIFIDKLYYAVPVGATIAKGRVTKLDASAAKAMKGVLAVYSHWHDRPNLSAGTNQGFFPKTDELPSLL